MNHPSKMIINVTVSRLKLIINLHGYLLAVNLAIVEVNIL